MESTVQSSLLKSLAFRFSPLGRAASAFRKKRADYYQYLAQILEDSNGELNLLDIFTKDSVRYQGKPRGVLNSYWTMKYAETGDLLKSWDRTLPAEDLLIIGSAVAVGGVGALQEALVDIARLSRRSELSKSQFNTTIFVGLLAVSLALGMAFAQPLFFVPLFQNSFSFVPQEMWGPRGQSLIRFASFMTHYWIPVAGSILTLFGAATYYLPRWTGQGRAKVDIYFLPYRLYRDARCAEFLATLGAVLKRRNSVSLNLREGIELIRSYSSPWLVSHCSRMLAVLDAPGEHDKAQVLNSGLLSQESVFYVSDMVEALGLDKGLQVAGLRIESEIEKSITKSADRLRVFLLVGGVGTVFYFAAWLTTVGVELRSATAIVFAT
jgi:hypothetical protein